MFGLKEETTDPPPPIFKFHTDGIAASTFCFSHLWFLAVQLLCPWMFALYFLITHCMTGRLRPIFLFNRWDLIWAVLCVPEIPGLWHFLGSQPNFPWLLFGLLTLANWAFLFFLYVFLKPFPFMGLWIPILWAFLSSFSSFFFFSFFITG